MKNNDVIILNAKDVTKKSGVNFNPFLLRKDIISLTKQDISIEEMKVNIDSILIENNFIKLQADDDSLSVKILYEIFFQYENKKNKEKIYQLADYLISQKNFEIINEYGYLDSKLNNFIHNKTFLNTLLKITNHNLKIDNISNQNPLSGLFKNNLKTSFEKEQEANQIISLFPQSDDPDLIIKMILNESIHSGIPWIVNSPYFDFQKEDVILKLYYLNAFYKGIDDEYSLKISEHHRFHSAINNPITFFNCSAGKETTCYPTEYLLIHFGITRDINFAESDEAGKNFRHILFKLIKDIDNKQQLFSMEHSTFIGMNLVDPRVNKGSANEASLDSTIKLTYLCDKANPNMKILFKTLESNAFDMVADVQQLSILYDYVPEYLEQSLSRSYSSSYLFLLLSFFSEKKSLNEQDINIFGKIFKNEKNINYSEVLSSQKEEKNPISFMQMIFNDKKLVKMIYDFKPVVFKENQVYIHSFCEQNNFSAIKKFTGKNIKYKPNTKHSTGSYPLQNLFSYFINNSSHSIINSLDLLLKKGENPLINTFKGNEYNLPDMTIFDDLIHILTIKAESLSSKAPRANVVMLLIEDIRKKYIKDYLMTESIADILIDDIISKTNVDGVEETLSLLNNEYDNMMLISRLLDISNERKLNKILPSKYECINNYLEKNESLIRENINTLNESINFNIEDKSSSYTQNIIIPWSIKIQKMILGSGDYLIRKPLNRL